MQRELSSIEKDKNLELENSFKSIQFVYVENTAKLNS